MTTDPESTVHEEANLNRTVFLARSLALVGSLALARSPFSSAGVHRSELAAFEQLSSVVTGIDNLPRQHAAAYFGALNRAGLNVSPAAFLDRAGYTNGHGPESIKELTSSAAYRARGGKECVDAVTAAWWSGIVPTAGGGQKVITYLDALVWRVMPFANPPTECLGAPGAWAKPGRSVRA
jgi:Membrane bound FAD containing D-sorbitol dehydrogenase